MESGGDNHIASSKSGAGNSGLSWDIWELGGHWGAIHHQPPHQVVSSAFFHTNSHPTVHTIAPTPFPSFSYHHASAQSGDAHHLTCLKLGKRQYYEEGHASDPAAAAGGMKRERAATAVSAAGSGALPSLSAAATVSSSSPTSSAAGVVPRCQVEGCNAALVDAKDYHRRHKVCEIHSKAPKVVVLGIEQRFCQQCSRFHVISEFDETKRSCRRRLAGHNERRRKSSAETVLRNPSPLAADNTALVTGFPYVSASDTSSRALSLLSPKVSSWVSPDLSSQSSAALRELIAENRAALLAKQLFSDRGWHSTSPGTQAVLSYTPHHHPAPLDTSTQLADGWDHLRGPNSHVTLDLMQMPSSSFEILSGRGRSKEDEEECCEIWKSLEGTHVV